MLRPNCPVFWLPELKNRTSRSPTYSLIEIHAATVVSCFPYHSLPLGETHAQAAVRAQWGVRRMREDPFNERRADLRALELPLLFCSLIPSPPAWRNWQTRWTQNPVIARSCGFDPLRRHSLYTRICEGKSNIIGTNLTSHRRARRRTDSPFIRQLFVNSLGS